MIDPAAVLGGLSAIIDALASFPGWRAAGLVLLGAVVAVDQASVAQLQLAHPLVAGTLAGAVVGRPLEGALAGALIGLLLAGHRPVGGVIPPDAGTGAVVAGAALARAAGAGASGAAGSPSELAGGPLAVALLLGLVAADLGRLSDVWTRRRNRDLLARAEAAATSRAVRAAVAGAVCLAALRGALTVVLLLPAIAAVGSWARRAPAGGLRAVLVVALVGGIGLAAGERLLGVRRVRGLVLAGAGAIAAVLLGVRP